MDWFFLRPFSQAVDQIYERPQGRFGARWKYPGLEHLRKSVPEAHAVLKRILLQLFHGALADSARRRIHDPQQANGILWTQQHF